MSATGTLKKALTTTAAGRVAMVPLRFAMAMRDSGVMRKLMAITQWSFASRERVNITYDTTAENKQVVAALVAAISGRDIGEILAYTYELYANEALIAAYARISAAPEFRYNSDTAFRPGKRLCYYLLVRALKSKCIVEAGVDKGFGAMLINAAVEKNSEEGFDGQYIGVEYSDKSCALFEALPNRHGSIVRADIIEFLKTQPPGQIDLFIHDTTAEAGHVQALLDELDEKLAPGAVFVSVWSLKPIIDFAIRRGYAFFQHADETVGHWHAGSRLLFLVKPLLAKVQAPADH